MNERTIDPARIDAIERRMETLADELDNALRLTGCTDPDNNRRDRALRDRQAWRESPEGQAFDAALRDLVAWWRREQANKAESRQRLGDWATRLGMIVAVVTLVSGFLTGIGAVVGWAIILITRWINGGAP